MTEIIYVVMTRVAMDNGAKILVCLDLNQFSIWFFLLLRYIASVFPLTRALFAPSLAMTEWNLDNPADLGIWEGLGWTQLPPAKKAKTTKCLKLKKVGANSDVANSEPENSRFVSPSKGLETYQQPQKYRCVYALGAEELRRVGSVVQLAPH